MELFTRGLTPKIPGALIGEAPASDQFSKSGPPTPLNRPSSPAWRLDGPHVGSVVTRTVLNDNKIGSSTVHGVVQGWLPESESDFINDMGEPAPLWRVRYGFDLCCIKRKKGGPHPKCPLSSGMTPVHLQATKKT